MCTKHLFLVLNFLCLSTGEALCFDWERFPFYSSDLKNVFLKCVGQVVDGATLTSVENFGGLAVLRAVAAHPLI